MRSHNIVAIMLILVPLWPAERVLAQGATQQTDLKAQLLVGKAVDRVNAFDNPGAMDLLSQALKLNSGNFDAHFWIGFIARQTAASDPAMKALAVEHFRAALAICPEGERGQTARSWLVRLTGRPVGIRVLLDSSGTQSDADLAGTLHVVGLMRGEGQGNGLGESLASLVAGGASDAARIEAVAGRSYSLASMPPEQLASTVRQVAANGTDGQLACGWVAGMGVVTGCALNRLNNRLSLPPNCFASMSVRLMDPVDGRIVQTFDVSNASLQYALGLGVLNKLAGKWEPLKLLVGSFDYGSFMLRSLAKVSTERLAHATKCFRDRELHDEIALPLRPDDQSTLWIRTLASSGAAPPAAAKEGEPAPGPQRSTVRTPGQVLALPRLAVAPAFCPDILAADNAAQIIEDAVSGVVANGKVAVLPASQVQRGADAIRATQVGAPLLRCYEAVARQAGARYLLLTWFDDYVSTVEGKNIVGSKAVVRVRGHYAIRDLQGGTTLVQKRFSFEKTEGESIGDVAERYLVAVDTVSSQISTTIAQSAADLGAA